MDEKKKMVTHIHVHLGDLQAGQTAAETTSENLMEDWHPVREALDPKDKTKQPPPAQFQQEHRRDSRLRLLPPQRHRG